MAVRGLQYAEKLERELAGGRTVERAHKAAVKKARVRVSKPKKYDEGALIKKVGRMLKMIYYGKEYHRKK